SFWRAPKPWVPLLNFVQPEALTSIPVKHAHSQAEVRGDKTAEQKPRRAISPDSIAEGGLGPKVETVPERLAGLRLFPRSVRRAPLAARDHRTELAGGSPAPPKFEPGRPVSVRLHSGGADRLPALIAVGPSPVAAERTNRRLLGIVCPR